MPSIIARTKEAGMAGYLWFALWNVACHGMICHARILLLALSSGRGGARRGPFAPAGRHFELRRRVCMHEDTASAES